MAVLILPAPSQVLCIVFGIPQRAAPPLGRAGIKPAFAKHPNVLLGHPTPALEALVHPVIPFSAQVYLSDRREYKTPPTLMNFRS
jgi:hypothetical protein